MKKRSQNESLTSFGGNIKFGGRITGKNRMMIVGIGSKEFLRQSRELLKPTQQNNF
jgi:hypothetical protein